jgi:two-component system, OmpR family, sensor kinase
VRSLSLRTRLVAVAVALVTFAVLATGVATYLTLRGFLYSRLDDQLAQAAGRPVVLCSSDEDQPGGPPPAASYVAKLDARASVLTLACDNGGEVANLLAISPADARKLAAGLGTAMTIRSTNGVELRAVAVGRTPFDNRLVAYSVVALPTGDVSSTLGRLLWLEALAATLAIVGTAVLGAVGVRIGLRPLDRVTRTARAVAAELSPEGTGLDRRVPAADPGTEVGQLAEAVNTMLDAVETEYSARYESEQRMRRFLADASHELRTPLTSLRGYAELIRLRGDEGTGADARDALRRIEAEGTRMSRLVDDLLTLARYDRGGPRPHERVDLADTVADAVAGVRAAHPDRQIAVTESAEPPVVLGDRDQLLRAVRNVITNAALHTRPDGPITVSTAVANGEAVVAVHDSGPGLPPEQAAHVFERFWRADAARTRARGGSGLGLSIVQALVAGHDGRVSFESSPSDGTTVTIRLPAAPAAVRAAAPASAAGQAAPPPAEPATTQAEERRTAPR